MTDVDQQLLTKFQATISALPTEDQANDFFAHLSLAEYDRLRDLFEHQPLENFSEHERRALVAILQKLRQALVEATKLSPSER